MRVEIDPKSGFCFGVVRAISEAEQALASCGAGEVVYSLGDIVHNRIEVQRLQRLGLQPITNEDIAVAEGRQLLIRAHGEPPSTYREAERLGIEVIDATCPVVAKLQQRVIVAYREMESCGGSVVLLGKRGHAEVVGLTGQVDDRVRVVECEEDLEGIDYDAPIYFLSQTTQSITLFNHLAEVICSRAVDSSRVVVNDTICRRVSSREGHLREFASSFDLIIFVCGKKSSNGRVLYELCRESNPRCYNIESEEELCEEWFEGVESVGVCGATSTPAWLMERVARAIEQVED
ncbi:MAG: 4-hydroxy-3-methylbut-2-enyl diphosphate reductase [Rikenellaceae bacterium]